MTDAAVGTGELAPEATLLLVDDGDRGWDATPEGVSIGAVRLAGWQVHPIAVPASFAGQDCYLIKLNYELALEPEVAAPPWFEVGLELSDPRSGGPVAVLDALPGAVFESSGPASYGVGGYLNFTPLSGADEPTVVSLPALGPFIDVFGVGSAEVRWRHMAPGTSGHGRGVRPGSRAAWAIVTVPAGCPELAIRLTARYDMEPDHALGCLPGTRPAEFRLALPTPADDTPQSPSVAPAAREPAPGSAGIAARPPRVFISYAHDDAQHVDSVLAFAEFLAACGLDVHLDRWDLDQRRDWYKWASGQVLQADYVIVVASPMCRLVGDWEVENTRHRGLQSELALLRELLHSDREGWTRKLLPVLLPGRSVSEIPLFLQPRTADHYTVQSLTVSGAEGLLRVLTGQPPYLRPAATGLPELPPRLRAL